MYAAIRQGKAKTGMAEELTRRIKEGAIPIISDVEGFMGYYVVYAPDDTVVAISLFNNYAAAEESNKRALAWIEQELAPLLTGPGRDGGRTGRQHEDFCALLAPVQVVFRGHSDGIYGQWHQHMYVPISTGIDFVLVP